MAFPQTLVRLMIIVISVILLASKAMGSPTNITVASNVTNNTYSAGAHGVGFIGQEEDIMIPHGTIFKSKGKGGKGGKGKGRKHSAATSTSALAQNALCALFVSTAVALLSSAM